MKRSFVWILLVSIIAYGELAPRASAGYVYAYAQQQITNLQLNGTNVTFGAVTWGTSTYANERANPPGTAASTNFTSFADSIQSFVGTGPAPGQNSFTPYGLINNDYTRGDVLISNTALLAGTASLNSVAEGYLVAPPDEMDTGSGNGSWSFSTSFKPTAAGASINYSASFANALRAVNYGPIFQSANAVYTFDFSITDTVLHQTVFRSSPTTVNSGTTLNFEEDTTLFATSGSFSVATPSNVFVVDRRYTIAIQGSASVNLTALVPEPSSFALVGIGSCAMASVLGCRWRMRLRKRPPIHVKV